MKDSISTGRKIGSGQVVLMIVLGLFALFCLLPVLLVVIVSFTDKSSIAAKGFSFFPNAMSLDGWRYVLKYGHQLVQSYKITIFETVAGTGLTLLFTSMFAFALSRKSFPLRGFLSIFLLIPMLFHGGMVANYILLTNYYGLRDNLLVLILPGAVGAYNCIVMRTFIQNYVPDSLVEAAKIDGANEFFVFFRVIIPLIVPSLGAIGFITAIAHWNEWQTAYLYIDNPDRATLQLVLIRIEKSLEYLKENMSRLTPEELAELNNAPSEPMRMAILLVVLGPILVAYPFFQRFFIKGITVGAVKG
ncbi:MAG: carbohydrate ABC transporter permease [Acetatifactor sp.]|nr:carbohydrate ABC transporter permease [Acetatifactor sp.]